MISMMRMNVRVIQNLLMKVAVPTLKKIISNIMIIIIATNKFYTLATSSSSRK
jgi:hypothetical protein